MTVQHHLDDATVVAFSAGVLPRPLALVAAVHVGMCAVCSRRVDAAASLGGALLSRRDAPEIAGFDADAAWQQMQARLDNAQGMARVDRRDNSPDIDRQFIEQCLAGDFDTLPWRRLTGKIAQVPLPQFGTRSAWARLFRFASGCVLSSHTHQHQEISLVLTGAYRDELGQFNPGDVSDLDASVTHEPIVVSDEPCIALIAADGHVQFHNPLLRLGARLYGL